MAKKLNIKGVIVEYDEVTWNGRVWTERELRAYAKQSERKFQEELRKAREAEQAEKRARERDRAAYQASLNVPNNSNASSTASNVDEMGGLRFPLVIVGGLMLACLLGVLFMR